MPCGGSRGIQEYILRSWSLVKMAHREQKKLFFNLRKEERISALEDGDMRPIR